jgi:recombination protein RecA
MVALGSINGLVKVARVKPDEVVKMIPPQTGGLYFGTPKTDVKFISSGCTTLDLALGGGWARRRIANIVGDKAVGKTLIAIEACANFNRTEPKGRIRYRETESAFDPHYAAALGFPVDRVDFGDPMDTVEDIFEDLQKVIEGAKGPELYIVDSLDALSDRSEMERDINEGTYGAKKAALMSQLFRRSVSELAAKDVTVIIVSQIRDNIGVTFGRKWTRSGGRSLDFYASQVLVLSQIERLYKTIAKIKRATGVMVKGALDKNKIGLPYREAQFPIIFGYGIDDRVACAEFIEQVTGEVVKKDIDLKELQRMVSENWWEIENKFLPKESKYK